jgi:hypothetical protein
VIKLKPEGSCETLRVSFFVTVQVVDESGNNDGGLSPRIAAVQVAVK